MEKFDGSFHSGHGSSSGPSWGSPATIDEVYLRNPMEPMDILKQKDPTTASESPRRIVGAVKTKTQFNYFRLSEDLIEQQAVATAAAPVTNAAPPSTSREEALLIDLSPDPPASSAIPKATQPFYQQLTDPLVLLPDQNRLYANYPSSSSPEITAAAASASASVTNEAESVYSPHYYSEVPVEPTTPTFTPPPSKTTSPARPIVTEELKKKRDEAFDWLGQALGEMTLSKSAGSSNSGHYSCISPISGQQQLKHAAHSYGFEDNFSVAMESTVRLPPATSTSPNGYPRHFHRQNPDQIEAARQPFYPKPGIWTEQPSHFPSAPPMYALPGPSKMSSVQTAHVRPFMMASAPHGEDGRAASFLMSQVQLSTPWATESEIKQALVIHNGNALEAIRFLQVEKLYR